MKHTIKYGAGKEMCVNQEDVRKFAIWLLRIGYTNLKISKAWNSQSLSSASLHPSVQ
jgi:hypothetical protein